METLLFKESPILGYGSVIAIFATLNYPLLLSIIVILLLFLIYFYRYTPYTKRHPDNHLISPCEGTVLNITHKYGHYYVAIFLSPFNRHTQIYPINGKVLKRVYDHTGIFDIVMYLNKSRNNEKKIHYILANNGRLIKLSQIAGFLPRMITSSEDLTTYQAGEYLGMMKFGSRVDMICPDDGELFITEGQSIKIGDLIMEYD
jgi:phosphatidylserine decarboxylase